jgi:hypothetical protein
MKRDGSELFENCKWHKTYLTFVRPHNLKYTNIETDLNFVRSETHETFVRVKSLAATTAATHVLVTMSPAAIFIP